MTMKLGTITKSLLATILTLGTAGIAAGVAALQNDGRVDGLEWLGLVAAVLTGLAVWFAKNQIAGVGYWAKAITALVGGIITGLVTSLAGNEGRSIEELFADLSMEQWLLLVATPIINAVMVAIAPNAQVSDDPPQPGGDPAGEYDPADLPSDDPADHDFEDNPPL